MIHLLDNSVMTRQHLTNSTASACLYELLVAVDLVDKVDPVVARRTQSYPMEFIGAIQKTAFVRKIPYGDDDITESSRSLVSSRLV